MKRQKAKSDADVFDQNKTIFSNNHRISPRQIRRTMTLEIFGISSLLLPGYLAKESGIYGLAALGIGTAGALLLLWIWNRLSDQCDFRGKSPENVTIGQRILVILSAIGLIEIASYVLYLLTVLLKEQLLTEKYQSAILITLTAAGVFGLRKGLECRIRVYEVLFWFLIIPLIVILILACVSVTPANWVISEFQLTGLWKSSYLCFMFFSISSLILFFKPHCNQPRIAAKNVRTSMYIVLALNASVYLILLGIFQDKLLAQLQFPVILLMAVVKLPGEFFERQDAFMIGIWFFCLFALFHSMLFYGKELLQAGFACRKQKNQTEEKSKNPKSQDETEEQIEMIKGLIWSCVSGAIAFTVACLLLHGDDFAERYLRMLIYVSGPVLLIFPFLYYICRRRL